MLVAELGSTAVLLLLVLACPIGMGLMMFFMARGMRGGKSEHSPERSESLAELKAEQARMAEKIEALERPRAVREQPHTSVTPEEEPDRVA